jgi:hypothetical protein
VANGYGAFLSCGLAAGNILRDLKGEAGFPAVGFGGTALLMD